MGSHVVGEAESLFEVSGHNTVLLDGGEEGFVGLLLGLSLLLEFGIVFLSSLLLFSKKARHEYFIPKK